jgi:hypothetical protein
VHKANLENHTAVSGMAGVGKTEAGMDESANKAGIPL